MLEYGFAAVRQSLRDARQAGWPGWASDVPDGFAGDGQGAREAPSDGAILGDLVNLGFDADDGGGSGSILGFLCWGDSGDEQPRDSEEEEFCAATELAHGVGSCVGLLIFWRAPAGWSRRGG